MSAFAGDGAKLRRLAAGRADGLTMAELAQRFNCSACTAERKLAELPADPPMISSAIL